MPLAAVFANEKATVYFDYGKDLHASEGNVVKTFELAGPDGIFYPAEVTVEGEGKLTVTATPMVKEATSVRYGWQPFTRANLVNGAGLPASTFASTRNKHQIVGKGSCGISSLRHLP